MISEHAANRFSVKNDSCGILGQVWYLVVSIPDLCHLSYFCSPVDVCISAFNRVLIQLVIHYCIPDNLNPSSVFSGDRKIPI